MFTILTEPTSGRYRSIFLLKNLLKKLLHSKTYGPNAVLYSLFQGLESIGNRKYNNNPILKNIGDTVYVPVGVDTLRFALDLKKAGKIHRLIAGPNISIPTSKNDIFFSPLIDDIIVPSAWVRDYFISLGVDSARIHIVPAGVDAYMPGNREGKILIYKKDCPDELFEYICSHFSREGIEYTCIEYGKFEKSEYLSLLDDARGLIYLQTSESQGIALHEAWMKDVPTLVWNRGYWEYNGIKWHNEKISAPYLMPDCGIFFTGVSHFSEKLHLFLSDLSLYSPRAYSLSRFSHVHATEGLLEVINLP